MGKVYISCFSWHLVCMYYGVDHISKYRCIINIQRYFNIRPNLFNQWTKNQQVFGYQYIIKIHNIILPFSHFAIILFCFNHKTSTMASAHPSAILILFLYLLKKRQRKQPLRDCARGRICVASPSSLILSSKKNWNIDKYLLNMCSISYWYSG
jgi:hypothetical protein